MSNDVKKINGGQEIDPFQAYADKATARGPITGNLLRYTKHGEYKSGANQEEVAEGTRMLAYLPGLKEGYVKWENQQPVQHIIGLVAEGFRPPERHELGDMDSDLWGKLNGRPIDPWQKTSYLILLDEEGQLHTFVTSSKGGISAIGELCADYAKHRRMKPNDIPIIELHGRSYQHRDFGETFAPVLKRTGWAAIPENFEELTSAIGSTDDEDDGDAVEFVPVQPDPKKPAAAAAAKKPTLVRPAAAVAAEAVSRTPNTKPKKPVSF
jgi:hypothetical protein